MTRVWGYLFPLILVAVGVALLVAKEDGLRINTTASMPYGLWRVLPPPEKPIRGMLVTFCMNNDPFTAIALERRYVAPGSCPSGAEPLLKTVAAGGGDTVFVDARGVFINDELQPNSAPLSLDPAGRSLPAAGLIERRLDDNEVWLMSTKTPLSFDSRYYGPISTANITGTAQPVWVW